MTHLLPPHAELNIAAQSTLQAALQMDPSQQQQQQQQVPPAAQPPPPTTSRKRRKADHGEDAPHPAEPRRLRRSHEACTRCRSKKIKCDSKHPRCTACATAGTPCQQEDRHRQALTPRGHTERIERQLLQCDALLKRHIEGFALENLDDICISAGIQVDASDHARSAAFQFSHNQPPHPHPQPGSSARPFPLRSDVPQAPHGGSPPRPYPYGPHPGQPMIPYGHPAMPMPYPPPGSAYGPPPPHLGMHGPPPPAYGQHMYPAFQHPLQPHQGMHRPPSSHDIKGQDPLAQDVSNTTAMARSFGVDAEIVAELKIPAVDREDLAVGSSGLSSGRDRDVAEPSLPRDASKWISVNVRRNSIHSLPPVSADAAESTSVVVWLPKDRAMVGHIVDVYFTRLNFHRPVFSRAEFQQSLDGLYDSQTQQHDPGFVCSVYILFALGTLSELNHRASSMEKEGNTMVASPTTPRKLMPADWPEHEEFFDRALAVKPDLRVTVSSLQALILLHWYLYTERQGRTLWRLVGSLVRLAIELGLHHDPTTQGNVFSEEECQLRIRLWAIVLLHDRGTSILLGRPLAIAPSDSNTPQPSRSKSSDASEHFVLSAPLVEIQADIINSLYAPTRQTADAIIRHATRIMKSMAEFRRQLPDNYKWFFSGSDNWKAEQRTKLVQDITEDQGLTLLKIGITRILLLRALFSSKELDYKNRYSALLDAIRTSHNIIVVHNQLIRFSDIAFFTSPIPLHIAAMVILYGHMSRCHPIDPQVALEDVWMALDLLPSFRWRWERKDVNGGHPLIAKLAEKVLSVNLHQVAPTTAPMLISELDWDTDKLLSMKNESQGGSGASPPMGPAQYPGSAISYGAQTPGGSSSGTGSPGRSSVNGAPGTPADKKLAEVPAGLFYPFYPENQNVAANAAAAVATGGNNGQDYNHILAAAASQPMGPYGYQSSQESYMLEEKDTVLGSSGGMHMWRPMTQYGMPAQQ